MLPQGTRRSFARCAALSIEPVAGAGLFAIALTIAWDVLTGVDVAVTLVMLAATFLLPWRPWAALLLALGYFIGWASTSVPWASMNLCGGLFVYNWFARRRSGSWWVAVGYVTVFQLSWVARFGLADVLANTITSVGITAFAAVAGWLTGKREESAERLRVEKERALRSTRLLVAGELHDSVAQTQTLLVMNLEDLAEHTELPPALAAHVNETLELSRRAAKELRDAMAALRNVDEEFGLLGRSVGHSLPRQWQQMRDTLRDGGFAVRDRFELDAERLTPEQDHTLSRLLGELVANLAWHDAPGACSIEAYEDDGFICLRTANEIAPDPPAKSGGSGDGLSGIRHRVELLGGSCTFGARGTTWLSEVRVPTRMEPAASGLR